MISTNFPFLSSLLPEQLDITTGNVDKNQFNTVLIVGQKSGASWTSSDMYQKPKPFDDADVIQEEFNRIKVFDPEDAPPFGFF